MNKRGKHKKGKTINPVPSQKEKPNKNEEVIVPADPETAQKSSEIVEDKPVDVKNERVPEIVSEVIPLSIDTKDGETPKKPKRNRGKKKKGTDEFDDTIEGESKEHKDEKLLRVDKHSLDIRETTEEPQNDTSITPTARKKKNKKKNVEQITDDPILLTPEQPLVMGNVSIKLESQKSETIHLQQTPIVQEIKPTKKRNKKKNRNDSERSDKEDSSCTPSFKQNVEDGTIDMKIEKNVMTSIVPTDISNNETEEITVQEIEKEIISSAETMSMKDNSINLSTDLISSKSEKQNQSQQSQLKEPVPRNERLFESGPILSENIMSQNIIDPKLLKDINAVEKDQNKLPDLDDAMLKHKAKIAKPVEKNRKEKKDCEALHIHQQNEIITEPLRVENSEFTNIIERTKSKDKDSTVDSDNKFTTEALAEDLSKLPKIESNQQKGLCVQEVDPFNVLDTPTGKKRKKGAKVPKVPDVSFEIVEPITETKGVDDFTTVDKNKDKFGDPETKDILQIDAEDIENLTNIGTNTPKEMCEKEIDPFNLLGKSAGKRRKKGAKIPRVPDVSIEMVKACDDKTDGITHKLSTTTDIKCESEMNITRVIESSSKTIDTTEKETQNKIQEHILLTPEIADSCHNIIETNMTSEISESNKEAPKPSGIREKKSISPSKEEMSSKPTKIILQKLITDTEKILSSEESKQLEQQTVNRSIIPKLYDIEITSIKIDEAEGTACDTVPDITYPRSSSQQLPDDNNNSTTIREIFSIPQITPSIPKLENIEVPSDDLVEKDNNQSSLQKTEKTDLKSKMLEVNQDMEELRLSIERSLAGLTSIEKDEASTEKVYKESILDSLQNLHKVKVVDNKLDKDVVENINMIENLESSKEFQSFEKCTEETEITKSAYDEPHEIQFGNTSAEKPAENPISLYSSSCLTPISETNLPQGTPTSIAEKLTETLLQFDTTPNNKPLITREIIGKTPTVPVMLKNENIIIEKQLEHKGFESKTNTTEAQSASSPICPTRKDQKNKKKKQKGKQDIQATVTQFTQSTQSTTCTQTSTSTSSQASKQEDKNKDEKQIKSETEAKGKQQKSHVDVTTEENTTGDTVYETIENFEDALTSSIDDVNQSFEMIVKESQNESNPKINIVIPDEKKTSIKPPKNLLGHQDIPVRSSKRDYKKEKDKIPNEISAKVKIKDEVQIETKQSKNTQTSNKLKDLKYYKTSDNEEFVYKYNFRKVFLQNICQVCNKDLNTFRVSCCYCNLVCYCGNKHKDEDWPQHQALCFAVSTIGHLKNQKHIYADVKNIAGHDYRLIRMQMIVSCEKILKRRLVPWEQEALLYPRMCAYVPCREWRQMKLSDCQGCAQISYCTANPDHYPKSHSRWCKSYNLYQKLVSYQQSKGRLEPKLPTKVMQEKYEISEKINEVLAAMYEEKIDMNDIQYAALTQIATAPLTAAYCHQICSKNNLLVNSYKSLTLVVHVVGAELQFEADALNKWEVFLLHLRPNLNELRVVLVNANLNPSKLPLELLGKVRLCENCRQNKRRVVFSFQETCYADYKNSEDFVLPDIVCAFNPSIQRSSVYNGKDPWPSTVNVIIKQKIPLVVTAYTMTELQKDCQRIKECVDLEYNFMSEPKYNNFASVRPDRNFISDDEMPLLFKNYCFAIICG